MPVVFDALISSDSVIVRPRDSAAPPEKYLLVSAVQSGNDQQQIGLFGPTASGTLALTFAGQTTAPIAFTAAPPPVFFEFTGIPVLAGVSTQVAIPVLPSPGFYTHLLTVELLDGPDVAGSVLFDLGAATPPVDFVLANPSGGGPVNFTVLFPGYVPVTTTLGVRFSVDDGTNGFWDVDAVSVLQAGHARAVYDDQDGSPSASSGSSTAVTPGGDVRFWKGSYTRFHGGGQAGMAYAVDPADAQSKFQALSSVGSGNAVMTFANGMLAVEFVAAMGATAQPGITSPTPGVAFPLHTVGGNVPSVVETTHAGTVLAAVPLRGVWIYEAGRVSGAVYPAAGLSTPAATSTYQVIVPAGWMATAAGPVTAGTVAADNRAGNHILPPFAETPKTMGMGYNVLSNANYTEIQQHFNMAMRISTAQTGFFNVGGPLAFNADLYPTWISPNGAQVIITQPALDFAAQPLGSENAPNGLYTVRCTDPGHAWVTLAGDFTTGCTTVSDTIAGDVRVTVYDVQVDPAQHRSPKIVMNWNASGGVATFQGNPALPVTVTRLEIYPPDTEADPTGMTSVTLIPTMPRWNPAFVRFGAGIRTLRTDQAMLGFSISNPYADISDIRGETQLGRDDFTRCPFVGVASLRQYTGPPLDAPKFLQILVTTDGPHTLFSGAFFFLHQCGTATFSDGTSIDVTDGNLNFGLITVIDATHFVWHAGQAAGGATGVTMTNVTSGGFLTASFGTGWSLMDNADYANTCGSRLHFNFAATATDACIDAVADFMAANLAGKFCPELGDEIWNFQFHPTEWVRIQSFQQLGLTTGSTIESQSKMQANISARSQARFALAGRPDDVVFMIASSDADPGRTSSLLAYCHAQGYRIDELHIALYYENIDPNATLSVAQGIAAPLGLKQDLMELWMDSFSSGWVAPHAAAIAASPYPTAKLVGYEGGAETLIPCLSIADGQGTLNTTTPPYRSPNYAADQHAMHRSWRFYWLDLNWMQHCQDQGVSLINRFHIGQSAQGWAYSTREWWDSRNGTGAPSENPDPEAAHFLSQDGGAIAHWNSLATTTPMLVCSPTTATVVGGTAVSITATWANTSSTIVATRTGGGTLSTSSPTSGVPFTCTTPSSGSGTIVVTVGDGKALSGTCTIHYAPPATPALTPPTASGARGSTVTFTASNFTGGSATLASSNTAVATVSGLVATVVGAGTTSITATGVADNTQTAAATLTGQAVTLSVAPTTATVAVGSTVQLTPTVGGAVNTAVTYVSANPALATVDGSGLVTGVAPTSPTVAIAATSVADGSITATCVVTVRAALAAGVATAGATTATTAAATAADASGGTVPYSYQWFRATTPGVLGSAVSGQATRTLADSGLSASTAYYYTLRYTDAASAVVLSNQVAATTAAAGPPVPLYAIPGFEHVTLP